MYWLALALSGVLLLLVIFTVPETAFRRVQPDANKVFDNRSNDEESSDAIIIPTKKTFVQTLKPFSGTYTSESMVKLLLRPLGMIFFPAVLWGAALYGITIGFFGRSCKSLEAHRCTSFIHLADEPKMFRIVFIYLF